MTRTSRFSLCALALLLGACVGAAPAQGHERIRHYRNCAKTRYSKLHTTLPVVYRLRAFAQRCIPYAYPPLEENETLSMPRYVRFPCQPVEPEESAVIYLNSTHRPSMVVGVPASAGSPTGASREADGELDLPN